MVKPIQVNKKEVLSFADLYSVGRRAPLWEQALVTVWFFVTYIPLNGVTPIRYLLVLYFLGIAGMFYRDVGPVVMKAWPLFLLPLLSLLSFMWSNYPSDAIRSGMLLIVTPLSVVVIAARLNTRQVMRCVMFAGMITSLYAIPFYSQFAMGGPYGPGTKNLFAIQMLFAMLLCLATALNQKEYLWIRMMALPFVPMCFVFQYLANSATSLAFSVVGIIGLVGIRYFWIGFGKVKHLRTSLTLIVAGIALLGAIVVLSMPENTIVKDVLGLLGKDSTFSGRTAIWREAELVSQDHPIWGVGLEGFWQYDVGAAQTINENDYKAFGTKLTFHNAFWEVRVHLGYVGLCLFILIVGWCSYRIIMTWIKESTMDSSALLIIGVIIFVSTFTESYLWAAFTTHVNLFYFAALTTLGAGARKFEGRVPVTIREAV